MPRTNTGTSYNNSKQIAFMLVAYVDEFHHPIDWQDPKIQLLTAYPDDMSAKLFLDGWGQELLIQPAKHSSEDWLIADIWSIGPNGIDEQGAGDDIALWNGYPRPDKKFDVPIFVLGLIALVIVVITVISMRGPHKKA